MVQIKETEFILPDRSIKLDAWLSHIAEYFANQDLQLIRSACFLAQITGDDIPAPTNFSCLQEGLATAELLHSLQADSVSISAALVYSCVQYADLDLEDVREQLGNEVANLISGIEKMSEIRYLQQNTASQIKNHRHIDNMRKMLVAMVEDVRVVLIKLAERTIHLRRAPAVGELHCKEIAKEIIEIYAPLANRLGISQIKWQMEDLAFRYQNEAQYRAIAKSLDSRRVEREQYVQEALDILHQKLHEAGIENVEINGRAKHIYSIYRKMQRKHVGIEEIYDALAVRVLTETVEDCYATLGIVHATWTQIPKEFDDYIATPKSNGYQSIHTAVIGPGQKNLEVQIRTHEMHKESELGVAAHWHYKAGGKKPTHEGKIAWLRQVIDWQKEVEGGAKQHDELDKQAEDDRIYVLSPKGEIKDLPIGSTPLDFAYNVHSEVGNRCRGAKINGAIVPLNYQLKTGEQVEILTGKHPQPSRDWMNPHLGYLASSKARAKVHHWFKQQDFTKNAEDGAQLLKNELNRLSITDVDYEPILKRYNYKSVEDLHAAIGSGDLRTNQVIGLIQQKIKQQELPPIQIPAKQHSKRERSNNISIEGVGDLLTHTARCCQPVPGDQIIGFITRGRGVAIHRQDCVNILHASTENRSRLIAVAWEQGSSSTYPVDISIHSYDRRNIVRDITTILSNESINIIALTTSTDKIENTARVNLTIEISDLSHLSQILDRIQQLPNIILVRRENSGT